MRKTAAALVMTMLLSVVTVYADTSLSIEEAKALALENSNTLQSIALKIESDEINAREMLAEKNRQKNTSAPPGYGITTIDTILRRRGYYSDAAAVTYELTKLTGDRLRNTIEFSAVSAYYALANKREAQRVKKDALDIANDNLSAVKIKYDLGTVSQLELQQAEGAVRILEYELDMARRASEFSQVSFNSAVGLAPDEQVTLTDTLSISPPEKADIEALIKTAVSNRYEVKEAQMKVALAEKEAECYEALYTKGTYHYTIKQYGIAIAKANLENAVKSVELSVRKSYNDYLDAYGGVAIGEESVKTKQLMYDAVKSKFSAGQVINTEVVQAQNALDSAKNGLVQAKTAYFMAALSLDYVVQIGLMDTSGVQ